MNFYTDHALSVERRARGDYGFRWWYENEYKGAHKKRDEIELQFITTIENIEACLLKLDKLKAKELRSADSKALAQNMKRHESHAEYQKRLDNRNEKLKRYYDDHKKTNPLTSHKAACQFARDRYLKNESQPISIGVEAVRKIISNPNPRQKKLGK
jgi:hypothetical protein